MHADYHLQSLLFLDLRSQIEKQRGLALVRQQKILFMEVGKLCLIIAFYIFIIHLFILLV